MKITLVRSSNIVAVGRGEVRLDAENFRGEALWMFFGKDGAPDSVYVYPGVSPIDIDAMLVAPSVGSYWDQFLKEERPYFKRLEGYELANALIELDQAKEGAQEGPLEIKTGPPNLDSVKHVLSQLRSGRPIRLPGLPSISLHAELLRAVMDITNAASAWNSGDMDTTADMLGGLIVRVLATARLYGIDIGSQIEEALARSAGEKVGK